MIFLSFYVRGDAATCVTTGSGLWGNSGTWSCGAMPTCGDSVVILAGHTVSITGQDYTGCATKMVIVIKGTLQFTAPGKLQLACTGKVYVFSGGQIIPALGTTGNANAVQQCGSTWWNASAGTYNGPGCLPPTTPGCASTLPIELVAFSGWMCSDLICIQWETVSELNNAWFDLERSGNGSDFSLLERVLAGTTASSVKRSYSITDRQPLKGINYYRIRQVDTDDSYEYFPMIAVEYLPPRKNCTLFPNPCSESFQLELNGYEGREITITVQDNFGNKICESAVLMRETSETLVVDLPGKVSRGVYLCVVNAGGNTERLKLLVQ